MAEVDGTTALAVVERHNSEVDLYPQMVMSLDVARAQLRALREFVAEILVPGEDYGTIPGTQGKPTLLKSGAEKLLEVYALTPEVDVISSREEWDSRPPFFYYLVKVRLVSRRSGKVMAEGIGSCNSRESRYSDRWATEKQLREMGLEPDGLQSKEFNGKYGPYRKYLVANDDVATLVNTIQKMAEKRALVSATLKATRASGIFTQDLEDIKGYDPDAGTVPAEPVPTGQAVPRPTQRPPTTQPAPQTAPQGRPTQPQPVSRPPSPQPAAQQATNGNSATASQVRAIYAIAKNQHGLSVAQVDERMAYHFGCPTAADLSRADASALIEKLQAGEVLAAAPPEAQAPRTEGQVFSPETQRDVDDLFPETGVPAEAEKRMTAKIIEGQARVIEPGEDEEIAGQTDRRPSEDEGDDPEPPAPAPFPGAWFWTPLREAGYSQKQVLQLAGMPLEKYAEPAHLESLCEDLAGRPQEWQYLAERNYTRATAGIELKRRGAVDLENLVQLLRQPKPLRPTKG